MFNKGNMAKMLKQAQDVVKYASSEFGVEKILIPTTFGTGAEMTTYCVLKFDGKKKLLGPEERFLVP